MQRTHRLLWVGMAVSVAFHVVVLFAFNRHTAKKPKITTEDAIPVALVMPDLKDLEDQEPQPSDGETPVDSGLSVPTLADVPTQIDLSTAFVQQIDYSSLVPQQDLSAAKALTVPTHINRGGKIGEGMGKIFDLKDLDRIPEALVQISPVVPGSLKQAGNEAQVTVGFIVDIHGAVVNPFVDQSSDSRFNDCALVAISKWKFRAGIKNGKRVPVRMKQPFMITVKDDT